MNLLDVFIITAVLVSFVLRGNRSFVYYLLGSAGLIGGYILAVILAPSIAKNMSSDLKKGLVSLWLMFGLAALLCIAGLFIGGKLKMKVILSRFFTVDKFLAWPYKLLAVLVAIVLLSQTLIYVPILALQFEAQGSSIFMVANKIFPVTPLDTLAQKIAPDQFRNLHLEYDPNPLTYNHIANAGEFQGVLNNVAPSVIKISGRNCTGLHFGSGFIAAPGIVVTNAHVISGASSIYMSDHDGAYPATPLVIDNDFDIAILYSKFIKGTPVPIASSPAALGTKAVTVGYPGGGDLKMKQVATYDHPYKSRHNKLDGSNTITLTGTLGPGSSGGPVFNLKGEIIGANDAGATDDLIAIRSDVVAKLVNKAKNRLLPTSTDFCAPNPKFY